MAEERHTTAFVVGFVLGGLAGAAVTLWKTPRSGAQLRALIAERAEGVLFRLTGMDEAQVGGAPSGGLSGSLPTEPRRVNELISATVDTSTLPTAPLTPETRGAAATLPTPLDAAPIAETAQDAEVTLPPTFRGQVLTEQPTDIVLDGPRPASPDR